MTAPLIDAELPASLNPRRLTDRRLSQSLRAMVWTDDWGRKWQGQAHRDTLHPVGAVRLHARYRVPASYLAPPPEFIGFSDDPNDGNRLIVKLGEWKESNASAWKLWRTKLWKEARKLYSDRAADEVAKLNPELIELVGPPPMHEKFLAAMEAGNRWVLGIPNPKTGEIDDTPAWATPDLMETLVKHETFAGGATPTRFDLSEFANPDDDGTAYTVETAPIVARLDGQAKYETLDEDPTPPRGARGQFQKKNP